MSKPWRYRPHLEVQIASAQTPERMETFPLVDLVFIDELHACLQKSIIKIMVRQPHLRTARPPLPVMRGREGEGRAHCMACRGVDERPVPHGQEGPRISEHIAHHLHRARSSPTRQLSMAAAVPAGTALTELLLQFCG